MPLLESSELVKCTWAYIVFKSSNIALNLYLFEGGLIKDKYN